MGYNLDMEKKKRQPSIKMKTAASLLVANRGNVSKSMREAGYANATARNPKNITESATWQELLDIYLPDDMLLRALSDDIEKKVGNRTAELTLATKIKGRLTEKTDVTLDAKIQHTVQPEVQEAIDNALKEVI